MSRTSTAPIAASTARTPPDHVIVLFGASGDLARRKLLPGMLHLAAVGLMPEHCRIIGVSRGAFTGAIIRPMTVTALH